VILSGSRDVCGEDSDEPSLEQEARVSGTECTPQPEQIGVSASRRCSRPTSSPSGVDSTADRGVEREAASCPTTDAAGNAAMATLTRDLIDLSIQQGGRFFLPYQLHYSTDQLEQSYPEIRGFFEAKRRYDPDLLLTNTLYERYGRPTERR
jgi:hypothetical protein